MYLYWFYELTKTMLSLIGMKHWQNEITTPDLSNLVRLNHIGQISSVSFCLETEVILTVWHILGFLLACMQGISSSCTIMIIYFLLDFHQIVAVHLSQSNGRYVVVKANFLFFGVFPSNEGNQRPKYLQNCDEKLDMGKHLFILVTN